MTGFRSCISWSHTTRERQHGMASDAEDGVPLRLLLLLRRCYICNAVAGHFCCYMECIFLFVVILVRGIVVDRRAVYRLRVFTNLYDLHGS